ncbi:alpha/beta hydrolase [Sphingopyxis sp. MWB1]|uniref:alpha/beta hydrolase n=1 Tax=Sphingopyxis sp. MWB1 TaxID=1537715 RepID=UPI00068F747E|nr:alpha/beta hydrolase [Sphingopyxis sp. MWB1]
MSAPSIRLPRHSAGAGARLHIHRWMPKEEAKAVVLLSHGYGEHAGRYAHVARRLNDAGYAIYAIDHWGHGRSDGRAGHVPRFSAFTDGLAELILWVERQHPALPRLLLGHSMGGLIATHVLAARQSTFAAAALSGPAIQPAQPPSRFLLALSGLLSRFFPHMGVASLDASAVSRDPDVVAAYHADPLVYRGRIGARLGQELLEAMNRAQQLAQHIKLPIFIQHGAEDRLADPAGSQNLFDRLGSEQKQLKLYPGLFHEIYNEPEREAVLNELVRWFDSHIERPATL